MPETLNIPGFKYDNFYRFPSLRLAAIFYHNF